MLTVVVKSIFLVMMWSEGPKPSNKKFSVRLYRIRPGFDDPFGGWKQIDVNQRFSVSWEGVEPAGNYHIVFRDQGNDGLLLTGVGNINF